MKKLISIASLASAAMLASGTAGAQNAPGVTPTEIKIGSTVPFSGPASAFSGSGKGVIAYVNYLNDKGGINGRKINFLALDDAYTPPKTVEQTRRLVESDEVAFIYAPLGTATNSATVKYINQKKVPHVFILSGASKFANFQEYPYTTTGVPSYEAEGRAFAKYIVENFPASKIAFLYQNDDLGRDYLNGFKTQLGDDFAKRVVAASYEGTDPTVDSQVVNLKASGAEVFVAAATPKFAAQAIRRSHEIGWKPQIVLGQIASSIGSTLKPAGLEISKGVISASWIKDLTDPKYEKDPVVKWYKDFLPKYLPGVDISDFQYVAGVNHGMLLEHLLRQCGNDLSRENILKQSRNLKGVTLPLVVPGIKIDTNESNSQVFTQFQMQRFNGVSYETVGAPISVLQTAKSKL